MIDTKNESSASNACIQHGSITLELNTKDPWDCLTLAFKKLSIADEPQPQQL